MLHNRLYIILLIILFAGCSKDKTESIFGEKPEDRMAKVLAEYKTTLTTAPSAWRADIFPEDYGGYRFYFMFETNDRVTMYSDLDYETAHLPGPATYRLKAVQRPSLLFDTYSYLHWLADPDPRIFNGVTGQGRSIDFEYSIDTVSADTIQLTGISFNNKMTLVRVSQAEADSVTTYKYADIIEAAGAYTALNPWLYIQSPDGKRLQFIINKDTKTFSLVYIDDANQVRIISTPYYFTLNGFHLKTPVTYNGITFDHVYYDWTKNLFYVFIDGQRVEVQVAPSSVVPAHRLLGVDFSSLIVEPTPMAGWTPAYTIISNNAADAILNGPYNLTLYAIQYQFDVEQQLLNLNVYVLQNGNQYLAQYPFSYTKTADGTFDFTALSFSGNASLIAADMKPMLDYIRNDHFRMDFLIADGYGKLVTMQSVEHADFAFSGYPQ
jgi:hypothetical protein